MLAYAFQAHDFRFRYVGRYSDRAMPAPYLWAALWGRQDGSVLWWTFLLGGYTSLCTWSLRDRLRELQPAILATLMIIIGFFTVLMLFAADPFSTSLAGTAPGRRGTQPLLQKLLDADPSADALPGHVGWAVPFAFCVAALVTGRLGDEWLRASRRWTLFAWIALAVGNISA